MSDNKTATGVLHDLRSNMPKIISRRAQLFLIWWSLGFAVIFFAAYYFLIGLLPLPPATLGADQVAAFYVRHSVNIRLGSIICSWCSAFMVPLATVIAVQMARLEKGIPIWSILEFGGGLMMSLFLVLPPVFWGVAAFSPHRPAPLTLLMHELSNLTLVTTDQYFIFQFVAIAAVSLSVPGDRLSPFPRWYGYYTIWTALMFELGAIGFLPKTGPFAWNGLFVYWIPLTIFGLWIVVTSVQLIRAIGRQADEALAAGRVQVVAST